MEGANEIRMGRTGGTEWEGKGRGGDWEGINNLG